MKIIPAAPIQELAEAIINDQASRGCNFLRGLVVFYGGRTLERDEVTSAFYSIRSDAALMRRLHETEVKLKLPVRSVLTITIAYLGQLYREHIELFPEGEGEEDGKRDD